MSAKADLGVFIKVPARIVVVHDDPEFRDPLVAALMAKGHDVAAFDDVTAAWDALAEAQRIEMLVTRIDFGVGKPHGIALARSARSRRPAVQVLFVARPEYSEDAGGDGEFMAYPASVPEVVEAVERMLANARPGSR